MKLSTFVAAWPAEWRELYEERAGIMEHEGGMTRREAERAAERDVRTIAERTAAPELEPGLPLKF